MGSKDHLPVSLDHIKNDNKHFILDGFVTDYVELTQDLSKSWKHLAEFDTNLERRCKMHKRRIDMNTNLIKGKF